MKSSGRPAKLICFIVFASVLIGFVAFQAWILIAVRKWGEIGGGTDVDYLLLGGPRTMLIGHGPLQDASVARLVKAARNMNQLPYCDRLSIVNKNLHPHAQVAIIDAIVVRSIHIQNGECGADCMDAISRQSQLEYLGLGITDLSVDGLIALQNMPRLKSVQIQNCNLTQLDVDRVRAAFGSRVVIHQRAKK